MADPVDVASGDDPRERTVWWATDSFGVPDYGVVLVISLIGDSQYSQRTFTYLDNLLKAYGDAGLHVVVVSDYVHASEHAQMYAIGPEQLSTGPKPPYVQLWQGNERVFSRIGAGLGLDAVRLLVQKHVVRSGAQSKSVDDEDDQHWFGHNWEQLEYWDMELGEVVLPALLSAENTVLLVIPGGCTACALSKYSVPIQDLAKDVQAGGQELFVLVRDSELSETSELDDVAGRVLVYSELEGDRMVLRTRTSSVAPYVCRYIESRGVFTMLDVVDYSSLDQLAR
jgi:hypothetical protein